jgi:penicillin-binding protein 2
MVDISHGIEWSCDTFYYTLAEKLGIDTIAKYATEVGLSQKTGVDLPGEEMGVMPSVGIGQGNVQVTPIQLARAIGGIGSGGALKRPHVVFPDQIPPEVASAVASSYPGSGDRVVPLSPENWETITDAMAETTVTGTAAASHLQGIDFAGKTGTAQLVNHSIAGNHLLTGNARANAWFVGMSPRRNPDIVVAVLAEHGGWGADAAAPLAAQVINAYVTKQRRRAGNLKLAELPQPTQKPEQKPVVRPTAVAKPVVLPSAVNGTQMAANR